MNQIVKHSVRFILFVLAQALIFNKIEVGLGIQPMIYPLFILLLPVETSMAFLLIIAFAMGICIDSISNTYGLHASSLLLITYLRPLIFKYFAPRDGYDPTRECNIFIMGSRWFLFVFGILLIIHHLWFFLIEMFKLNGILFLFQKTLLSAPISFLFCLLLQYIFVAKPKER